jgi:SecD/SecF fusion protein
MGRIMVELPGIKEPERVRKLLQGSANLEFWETYTAKDVTPYLQAADTKLRAIVASETPAEEADSAATEAPAVAQATSTADSLAAAPTGRAPSPGARFAPHSAPARKPKNDQQKENTTWKTGKKKK